jgi:hypothetical protein
VREIAGQCQETKGMIEDQQRTMQVPPTGGVHAKVEKGMAGKYGWSLSVTIPWRDTGPILMEPGEDAPDSLFETAIRELKKADARMRQEFGGEA